MRRARVAALLVVALGFMGADGAPMGCGAPPPMPTDMPSLCPPPTIAQCTKPETPCDAYFAEQAKTDVNAACGLLMYQAARAEAGKYPRTSVRNTTLFSTNSVVSQDDGGFRDVAAVPEDSEFKVGGFGSLQLGSLLKKGAALKGPNAVVTKLAILQKRNEWEANGDALDSCQEYVHEKYYDYTAFEDRVLVSNGFNKHRAIVDVAFNGSSPAQAPRWALGTRHLIDPKILARDGSPSGVALTFGGPRPKNEFFATPPVSIGQPGTPVGPGIYFEKVPTDANGMPLGEDQVEFITFPLSGRRAVKVKLKNLKRTALDIAGPAFEDPTLAPTIAAGATVTESLVWHRDMNVRNATVPDEVMEDLRLRRRTFRALLERRDKLVEELATLVGGGQAKVPAISQNKFKTRWWLDPVWNPSESITQQSATTNLNVLSGLNAHPGSAITGAVLPVSVQLNKSKLKPSALELLGKVPQVTQACGPNTNPIICRAYQLANLDTRIETALLEAKALGCLNPMTGAGPAPCDWSPSDFSQSVMGLFEAEREKTFRRCDESVDSFALAKNRAFIYPPNPQPGEPSINYPAQDYTTSLQRLETYFARLDEYVTVLADTVGPLLERTGSNRVKLHKAEGDSETMGNKWFGAEMSYAASFSLEGTGLTDTDASECTLTTRINGDIYVGAQVLAQKLPLVQAKLQANDTTFLTYGDVLGQTWSIGDDMQPVNIATGAIAFFSEGKQTYETFGQADAAFSIGPVVIRVGGSVGGGLGYMLGVQAGRKTNTMNGCSVSELGVWPSLIPFTFVDGQAYAAVEALIARAGVKGYLTLVKVGVPISGELSLGASTQTVGALVAKFGLGAKITLEFFAGRIVVFLEVGVCPICESFEGTIVEWGGVEYEIPLFDFSLEVIVADLRRVAQLQNVVPVSAP
ncbi:MAG: hypothetical protein JNJ54_22090 [Myxococcaceae bacterium]|nr:hypothetical protein [Myxococcaceae bacterium]